MGAVKDVVAEHQRAAVGADELAADQERLREPSGAGCTAYESAARTATVAEQPLEAVLSCGVVMTRMSRMPASISVDSG